MLIFGKLAHEYPQSHDIKINLLAGEETAQTHQVKTSDLLSYIDGDLSDDDILTRIASQDFRDQLEEKDFFEEPSGSFTLPTLPGNLDPFSYLNNIDWENKKDIVYLIVVIAVILIILLLSVKYLIKAIIWVIKKVLSLLWSLITSPFRKRKKSRPSNKSLGTAQKLISQAVKKKEITREKAEQLLRDLEKEKITPESIKAMFGDM